jgi:hypothetical protein|tara:strand:- start:146 stop:373 length:228 start_codon:yes stop_codon:yes gene_type:complete
MRKRFFESQWELGAVVLFFGGMGWLMDLSPLGIFGLMGASVAWVVLDTLTSILATVEKLEDEIGDVRQTLEQLKD